MAVRERLEKIAGLTGLGDVTALAKAAGVEPGTAQKHKDRDSIPAKKVPLYIDAARKNGVEVTSDWLQFGRGQPPKQLPPGSVTVSVQKIPTEDPHGSVDKDDALRLPLWQLSVITRGAAETVPVLTESRDKVLSTDALRDFTSAFAVRMWDSSNGPYLPRGIILYVERPYGGAQGDLCLFAESHNHKEVTRPLVGVLDRETDSVWIVIQHKNTIELPKAQFPVCWRIKHTRRD